MHWLLKVAVLAIGNAFALWVANKYVSGFVLNASLGQLLFIALLLTLLNFFVRPLLILLFGPIIILTLGLGVLIVNAIMLELLSVLANHIDILHGSIIIQDIPALFFATVIVSVINFVIHLI